MALTVGGSKPAQKSSGRSTTKPKPSTAKGGRKTQASKPAARSTAKAASAKTKASQAKATTNETPRRNVGVDPKVRRQHEQALKRAGDAMVKAREAHQAAVDAIYEAVGAARADGISMATISELTNTSRQWLYKMPEHAGRNGSNKPAAKASTAKRSTGTTRKAPAKSKSSTGSTRPKINVGGKRK